MPTDAIVLLHGGLGGVALLAGLLAALAPKRPGLHPRAGRVFSAVMLASLAAIAVPIVLRQNVFMLGLGTVAFFAIGEGWRGLWRFQGRLPAGPAALDRLLVGWTALCAAGLGLYGVWGLARSGNPLFGVCLAFAALALVLVRAAVGRWRQPPPREQWLAVHIGHMTGALGAAVTAAAVVNLEEVAGSAQWLLWVGPTAVAVVWGRRALRQRGLS